VWELTTVEVGLDGNRYTVSEPMDTAKGIMVVYKQE
jgi:hypothetical protein